MVRFLIMILAVWMSNLLFLLERLKLTLTLKHLGISLLIFKKMKKGIISSNLYSILRQTSLKVKSTEIFSVSRIFNRETFLPQKSSKTGFKRFKFFSQIFID
jgi:hypothetical protein